MSTATLEKPFQKQNGFLTKLFDFPEGQKSVSVMKKVILITTDRKNVTESGKMLKWLENTIEKELPYKSLKNSELKDLAKIKECMDQNILQVNKFFETIENLFDHSEEDVKIDDQNMIDLMVNMELAKEKMSFITDYISLSMDVHKSKTSIEQGKAKKYSFEEFKAFLNVA